MEITQLKYFYTLAQNQHVTRTAEQLHIAQPSLTQSIRRLEKELGVKLFKTSVRNPLLDRRSAKNAENQCISGLNTDY